MARYELMTEAQLVDMGADDQDLVWCEGLDAEYELEKNSGATIDTVGKTVLDASVKNGTNARWIRRTSPPAAITSGGGVPGANEFRVDSDTGIAAGPIFDTLKNAIQGLSGLGADNQFSIEILSPLDTSLSGDLEVITQDVKIWSKKNSRIKMDLDINFSFVGALGRVPVLQGLLLDSSNIDLIDGKVCIVDCVTENATTVTCTAGTLIMFDGIHLQTTFDQNGGSITQNGGEYLACTRDVDTGLTFGVIGCTSLGSGGDNNTYQGAGTFAITGGENKGFNFPDGETTSFGIENGGLISGTFAGQTVAAQIRTTSLNWTYAATATGSIRYLSCIDDGITRTGAPTETGWLLNSDGDVQIAGTIDTGLIANTTTATWRPPAMDTTARDNLTPVAGDMIYNTTTGSHQGYDGIWNDLY